jgi:hypothetical protein
LALNRSETGDAFDGESKVVKNDAYELRFAFPRGTNFMLKSATARGPSGQLPVHLANHQGWAVARFTSPETGDVKWSVQFAPADFYDYPTAEPAELWAERSGLDGVNLHWREQYYLNTGYQVYLNGTRVGYTPNSSFALRGLEAQSNYVVQVRTVWENGKESPRRAELKFSLATLLPAELSLLQLEPAHSNARWRGIEADETLATASFLLGGQRFETGMGAFPNSESEYDLKGLFDTFSVLVGIDATSRSENAFEFLVLGDGKELWRSGPLKKTDEPKATSIEVSGVQKLVLKVSGQEGRGDRARADWVEPKLARRSSFARKEDL